MAAGGKVRLKEAFMLFIARRALAVVLLVFASTAISWAQAYPDRPLRRFEEQAVLRRLPLAGRFPRPARVKVHAFGVDSPRGR